MRAVGAARFAQHMFSWIGYVLYTCEDFAQHLIAAAVGSITVGFVDDLHDLRDVDRDMSDV